MEQSSEGEQNRGTRLCLGGSVGTLSTDEGEMEEVELELEPSRTERAEPAPPQLPGGQNSYRCPKQSDKSPDTQEIHSSVLRVWKKWDPNPRGTESGGDDAIGTRRECDGGMHSTAERYPGD